MFNLFAGVKCSLWRPSQTGGGKQGPDQGHTGAVSETCRRDQRHDGRKTPHWGTPTIFLKACNPFYNVNHLRMY